MKRILLLLFTILPLIFISCDKESCKNTERVPISFPIKFIVHVAYPDGTVADGIHVGVGIQKHWCSGDFSIIISYSGYTTDVGKYEEETAYSSTLENDLDYMQVTIKVGTGEEQIEKAYQYYYSDIIIINGMFWIEKWVKIDY